MLKVSWELHLLLLLGLGLRSQEALPPPCESQIYCHGELLHQIQMAKLYQDDKQFVDMSIATSPDEVLQSFSELAVAYNHSIPRGQLQEFVQRHFQPVGQELEPWVPEDWKDSPQFLQKISDAKLRAWAEQLHQIWKRLGKKMKPEILSYPERFSLIYSEHPFIVPGGRFVEFYYWDSYWVMEGLLLSEMASTVKGMLQNFLDLVETYGHIPNGGRVYYLQRSQPPLLTLMMDLYVTHTKDVSFLQENIGTVASELDFWTVNRTITVNSGGRSYNLNRYYVPYGGPRPESYSKDADLANTVPEGLAKSDSPRTREVAFQLAQNWIRTNFKVYSQTSAMYEKYDISNGGHPGGGGEYEVQEGFGWTNGLALVLLDHYGDQLTSGTQLASLGPHCLVAALLISLLLQ
ncbi:trehalase [Cricetulus griseus]|uniref:Trehalase n=1 Tax=Cricetulus griseus TaxID=10029 RepID=A0A061I8A1_CRIGR|nr:trehalase [Cricetulus griseus]